MITRKNGLRLLSLGAAAVTVVSLAACSNSGSGDEASGDVAGTINYSFWGNPARAEKVGTVADLFQEEFPEATVEPEAADYLPYIERLTVRAAGGNLACATAVQSTFLAQYGGNGVLRDLGDLQESGQIDTTNIAEDILSAGQVDGTQYMIPTGTFMRLFAYNEEYVKAAGVATPTDDMTWEEWADWLRELQPGLPAGVYATENDGGWLFTFTSWVFGHGQKVFEDGQLAFDKELLAEYFEYWLDLAEDGIAAPPTMIPEQTANLELSPIGTGRTAVASRDIPHFPILENALAGQGKPSRIIPVSMPSEDPDVTANVIGANGIAIPEDCDNIPTAAAFTNFFTNDPDAALAFQSDNGVVTSSEVQEALLADGNTPEGVKNSINILRGFTESADFTTTEAPEGYSTVQAELLRVYQSAAFGDMTVDEAVDTFFASAEQALN